MILTVGLQTDTEKQSAAPAPYYEVDFYNEWSLQGATGRNSGLSVVSETDSITINFKVGEKQNTSWLADHMFFYGESFNALGTL